MKFLHTKAAEDTMDDPAAVGVCEGPDVGILAVVGFGIGAGVEDVALQLTIARSRTTTDITRQTSARLPALIGVIWSGSHANLTNPS